MTDEYDQQAARFLAATKTSFKATFIDHMKHFADDKECRDVYHITLSNPRGRWTFRFGQSISHSDQNTPPTPYDVLACITKNDPGSFKDFCGDFGYEEDSRKAERTYKAVLKEWAAVQRMFTEQEIEQLRFCERESPRALVVG